MSRHRSARPRYGRIALAVAALAVTGFSVLGGVGVIPSPQSAAYGERPAATKPSSPSSSPSETAVVEPALQGPSAPVAEEIDPEALPAQSGKGRRIVFSETEQRVWLVRKDGTVRRTYLVSGSTEDNLDPGRYSVFSRVALGRRCRRLRGDGVLRPVRPGEQAAIGFHTIPTKLGTVLQSRAQLGTPQSHGCIRQAKADAISLWNFAPEGSTVVVI
ncbi:L,D-transpeptidase [Nocardioides sp. B-3]|uniref:L,D-transpeptidase n=1 Tax=Nocardioides sp. B-3 TaxID=2895565 RepID=UPI002152021A|nr:L,D-transpeptidase [Nocardioides sp. B-3]UUZ58160.1 L,D-transpeptidase [Nocardioides sp. B-3]